MVESFRPTSLAEAVKIRKEQGAIPFAGGTDLMVRHRYETGVVPDFGGPILFIDKIEEIGCVERNGENLRIGGGASMTQVLRHEATPQVLREAVRSIAAPALRNVGTLAGNLCNASPAGDSILALYALGAEVELRGVEETRVLPVQEFITGPGKNELREDELVSAIVVPLQRRDISFFRKVGTRKANALTKVSLAGVVTLAEGAGTGDKEAVVEDIGIAIGAVAPTVIRSKELEERLLGRRLGEIAACKDELLARYYELVRPIDDQRSTARYRKRVAQNMLCSFFEDYLLAGIEK